MLLSFHDFREIKDKLPNGSMRRIADELSLEEDTVRNYFGGSHYDFGKTTDVHYEKGANGGYVRVENERILKCAMKLLQS